MKIISNSNAVNRLLFDYESIAEEELQSVAKELPRKILRWIAMNHPDNSTRVLFYRWTNVEIGEKSVINTQVTLHDDYEGLVTFGSRVAVANGVTIVASSAPNNSLLTTISYVKENIIQKAPVLIEDNVWVGAHAVILPGVTLGEGAIIGAGAVVTKNVKPYTVVAGVPATFVKQIPDFPTV